MSKTLDGEPADSPAVHGSNSPKTFGLIVQDRRRIDLRHTDGRAEVVWRLENKKRHPARGRLEIKVVGAADPSWIKIVGEKSRDFRSRETLDYGVQIAIPPDSPTGTFEIAAVAVNEANPDQDFTENEGGSVAVDWEPVPAIRRVGKWKLALAVLALLTVLTVLGVVGRRIYRDLYSEPRHVLAEANAHAADADWNAYWNCWTPQGRYKLAYWQAYELRKESAKNPRWRDELQAWLPSMGLTLKDLEIFEKPPGDVTASEATDLTRALLAKLLEHGHSGESFFVTAAKWNQVTEQDEKDNAALVKAGAAVEEEFITRADMLNMFRFRLLCEVPIRQGLASEVREYFAITYRSMKANDEAAIEDDYCVDCSAIGAISSDDESRSSEGSQVDLEESRAAWERYRESDVVRLAFVKRDGAWLLDGFRNEGVVKGETWHARSGGGELLKVVALNNGAGEKSLSLHFADGTKLQADVEKLPAVDQDWSGTFLFVERDRENRPGRLKGQHDYTFHPLGDVFLEVRNKNAPTEVVYLSKSGVMPAAGVFLGKDFDLIVDLSSRLDCERRFVFHNRMVDVEFLQMMRLKSEKLTLKDLYVADASGDGSNDKQALLPIRKLEPSERLPSKQTIYLEFEGK